MKNTTEAGKNFQEAEKKSGAAALFHFFVIIRAINSMGSPVRFSMLWYSP